MADTAHIQLVVFVDENGDWAVGHDADSVKEDYEAKIGELPVVGRTICVTLSVPLPVAAELSGTVPQLPADGLTLSAR